MVERYGNYIAFDTPDLFLFTCSSRISLIGTLVMNTWGGEFVKQHFPAAPKVIGQKIRARYGMASEDNLNNYYLFHSDEWPVDLDKNLGVFQVTESIGVDMSILNSSCVALSNLIRPFQDMHGRDPLIFLDMPRGRGVNNPSDRQILELLGFAPDYLHIWWPESDRPRPPQLEIPPDSPYFLAISAGGQTFHARVKEMGIDPALFDRLYTGLAETWWGRVQQLAILFSYHELLERGEPDAIAIQNAWHAGRAVYEGFCQSGVAR